MPAPTPFIQQKASLLHNLSSIKYYKQSLPQSSATTVNMQFKTITAILLGITATGALAGPVAQPGVAIQARADQAQQAGQAQQTDQAKQAGQAKAGKQDYDPEDFDDNDYYNNNDYGDRYQQGGLDQYRHSGYGQGYNNRGGNNGYDNYNNGYNYGRPYRGDNQGGYGRGGYGRGGYGYGQQDHCPLQSCYAPNGCNGWQGFCRGGVNAGCPCFD